MLRLLFHTGERAGTDVTTCARVVRIGRDPSDSDVVLGDEQASLKHCTLTVATEGRVRVEDLNSSNGTFVNGTRMSAGQAVFVVRGDRVRVGRSEIEIAEGQPRLAITGGRGAGREFPVGEEAITIGRKPENTVVLPDHLVSSFHAAILPLAAGYVLKDNGSSNGTLVNGDSVEAQPLSDGDTIQIGVTEFRFLIDDVSTEVRLRDTARASAHTDGVVAHIVFVAGPHKELRVPVGDGQTVFGRTDDCDVTIGDVQVSGTHCAVTGDNGTFQLTDLDSSNGTFLNGERITGGRTLSPGDVIRVGLSLLEFQVLGGAKNEPLVVAEGAYEIRAEPRFLIDGRVIAAETISLGRSPENELRVEGPGISGRHCSISWDTDGFYVEDLSRYGTFLGDRRVVREKLYSGHVLRVGQEMLRVFVRGERLTLERIDAATALAAIEVARERARSLAKSRPEGGKRPSYHTVFKLDLPDAEALVQERKAKFKEGAPAWRPSTDILPDGMTKMAVVAGTLSAAAIVAALLLGTRADALVNHPLSEAHGSRAFAAQAEAQGDDICSACHSAGQGVLEANCVACHAGRDKVRRLAHQKEHGKDGRATPGGNCGACHVEHRGTARLSAAGTPNMLGANQRCGTAGCHENQHADDFTGDGPAIPTAIATGPVPSFELSQVEFHAKHAIVEKDGRKVGVGCTSCHARVEPDKGLVPGPAGTACFQCHDGGKEFVGSQCASCHEDEHGAIGHVRRAAGDPDMERALPVPTAERSLARGGALAVFSMLPFLGIALAFRVRRRRRERAVVQSLAELPTEVVKRLVHSINPEKCVGCNLCVAACPASVLELVHHKSAVVNFDACIQCKKCEDACNFDALRMHDADKPPPMVSVPEVDRHYQTTVPGMYLVGQAAGTPQVKNAANLGRVVVDHMVSTGLRPGQGQTQLDVVIVGSGPAGLSAALSCASHGLRYVVLEKQRDFAWTIRNYYHKGKPVMAEPDHIELVGLLPHWDTEREALLAKWQEVIEAQDVAIEYSSEVASVRKQGDLFHVGTADGTVRTAARVVLAIGTMGNPRMLGCPGDKLEKVRNALVDPDEFRDQDILVVGGTDSAIEVVLALAQNNRVSLSCRRQRFDRVKPKNLKAIEQAFEDGRCRPFFATTVQSVGADTVELTHRGDGRVETLPNHVVFAMIGGHPPVQWLTSIGVTYTEKPHAWSPPPTDALAKELSAEG